MFDAILGHLRGKRILILGFGREGKSSLRFLQKYLPDAYIGIADKNAKSLEGLDASRYVMHVGDDYLDAIHDYVIVIKTPGISLKDIDIQGVNITSQTDLFLESFHDQTIGITGTKGKSTTSSLIYHLLSSSGRDCILTGNIGIPCFDVMESIGAQTIVVYELSAHQLEFVHNSPKVGVLLNLFEEHLDHFGTFERYKQAKMNIMRFMKEGDFAVVPVMLMDDVLSLDVNSVFFTNMECDLDEEALPIHGEHNLLNVKAALCACSAYGVDFHELIPYLYTFKPLEHRLELVGVFGGITFVNDSISTIPQACIAACKTLGKVDFLLIGGFDRGIDYGPLVDFLSANPVPDLLYTGLAGRRVLSMLKAKGYQGRSHEFGNLEEAFQFMSDHAHQGDVCLLSPAAASYDQYKNFEERGNKFKELASRFVRK